MKVFVKGLRKRLLSYEPNGVGLVGFNGFLTVTAEVVLSLTASYRQRAELYAPNLGGTAEYFALD